VYRIYFARCMNISVNMYEHI